MRTHNRHTDQPRSFRVAVLDLAGGVALFVLLFGVLHLPVVT